MRRIRSKLTYANVMATLAVFLVLGGGAYAASKIGPNDIAKNAVRSKHIKRGNVKRSDLGANAVNSAKVANGSLRLSDIVVAQKTLSFDQGMLLGNQCGEQTLNGGPFSRVKPGDVTLVFPRTPSGTQVPIDTVQLNSGQGARLVLCNTIDSSFDPPARDFKVIVLR
jgi:hypothetical protein